MFFVALCTKNVLKFALSTHLFNNCGKLMAMCKNVVSHRKFVCDTIMREDDEKTKSIMKI